MLEWNIGTARFLELHQKCNGNPLSLNIISIAGFGACNDGLSTWIALMGSSDDIVVRESYGEIKKAIEEVMCVIDRCTCQSDGGPCVVHSNVL